MRWGSGRDRSRRCWAGCWRAAPCAVWWSRPGWRVRSRRRSSGWSSTRASTPRGRRRRWLRWSRWATCSRWSTVSAPSAPGQCAARSARPAARPRDGPRPYDGSGRGQLVEAGELVGVLGHLFAHAVGLQAEGHGEVVDDQPEGDDHALVGERREPVDVAVAVAAEVADDQDAAEPDHDPPRVLERPER